jgi:acetyl-CoA carboxylase biotin carboxyl carrier protein
MTFKEIQELIKLISKSDISEFKIKEGDFQLLIRTTASQTAQIVASQPAVIVPAAAPTAAAAAPVQESRPAPAVVSAAADEAAAPTPADTSAYKAVKAPMVGTFYRSPSPDKPAFVKVGDKISAGSPVCIIEAMKLFNEIESEVSGTIVKVMVEDAQPVEYDQVLFLVDPNG